MTDTIMLTKNTDQLRQQVAAHVAADSIAQGDYWNEDSKRGCWIGCLAHANDPEINEQTYGLPVMVQRIAESIFEALPPNEAKTFFAALPDAVGCDGKDLSKVGWQFLAAELRALPKQPDEVQVVIDPVIAGMDLLASGQEWASADAAAVAAVLWQRDTLAATAAAAAARAAAARAAAFQQYDTFAWAAHAAARAARADRVAARRRQRDTLLALISQAPVLEGGND